ncbi:MAG: alpha/beta hydrolase [Spirochaetia bacterium]|nr:alpha/beta hydrolase [Spirochaetia bacterium]
MKKILTYSIIFLNLSCFRLDSFLFDPEKITSYQLDNYTGHVQFKLDSTYAIDPALISIFTMNSSDANGKTVPIYAIYIGDQARIPLDKVILYCEGNSHHMDYYWQRGKLLANLGPAKNTYGVMMFDYQGYGMSGGKPSESNLYRDTDAALGWLKSKGLTNNRLIMYGYSMGSAPATNLTANARSMQPGLLILESPFASAAIMAQDGSGLDLPGSYFTNLQIDNGAEIKKVTEPFLWMHGKIDDFVNIGQGEIVYVNYGGAIKKAVRVDGAGHSDVPKVMGYDTYLSSIHSFIQTNLP